MTVEDNLYIEKKLLNVTYKKEKGINEWINFRFRLRYAEKAVCIWLTADASGRPQTSREWRDDMRAGMRRDNGRELLDYEWVLIEPELSETREHLLMTLKPSLRAECGVWRVLIVNAPSLERSGSVAFQSLRDRAATIEERATWFRLQSGEGLSTCSTKTYLTIQTLSEWTDVPLLSWHSFNKSDNNWLFYHGISYKVLVCHISFECKERKIQPWHSNIQTINDLENEQIHTWNNEYSVQQWRWKQEKIHLLMQI